MLEGFPLSFLEEDMRRCFESAVRYLRKNWLFFVLLTPAVMVVIAVVVYPMGHALYSSLFKFSLAKPYIPRSFVSLNNYASIFSSYAFWISVGKTLFLAVGAVWAEVFIGFVMASLLNRRLKGLTVFRTIAAIPVFLPPVVVGYMWKFLLNADFGLLTALREMLGMKPLSILGSQGLALPAILLIDVWQHTPFCLLLFLAGLSSLPKETIEAARIDGAGPIRVAWHITIPLLRPILAVMVAVRTFDCFKMFDKVFVLTGGGPAGASEVVSIVLYKEAFVRFNSGYAAALSWVILIISMVLVLLYLQVLRSKV